MAAIQELSDEQLVHRVFERERELVHARFRHSMNQLENTAHLGQLRREIARLKTEARVREDRGGYAKGELLQMYRKTFAGATEAPAEAAPQKGGFLSGIVDKLSGNE